MVLARAKKLEVRRYASEHGLSYMQAQSRLNGLSSLPVHRGQVIGFSSTRGGAGKTSTALIAAILLRDAGKRVALIDGDLRDGQIRFLTGGPEGHSSADLRAAVGDRDLTEAMLASTLHSSGGVDFLYAPTDPRGGLDELFPLIAAAVEELRKSHDYVLIDTLSNWQSFLPKALLGLADRIVVLTDFVQSTSLADWRARSELPGPVIELRRALKGIPEVAHGGLPVPYLGRLIERLPKGLEDGLGSDAVEAFAPLIDELLKG